MVEIEVELDDAHKSFLTAIAERRGIPVSEVVEEAILLYVERNRHLVRPPCSK